MLEKFGKYFLGGLIEVGFTVDIQNNVHILSTSDIFQRVFLYFNYNTIK